VWHASISIASRGGGRLHQPKRAEANAIAALAGVGDPHREWWLYNPRARVGHLRIPVTLEELELIPPGIVTMDAGATGPQRKRRATA